MGGEVPHFITAVHSTPFATTLVRPWRRGCAVWLCRDIASQVPALVGDAAAATTAGGAQLGPGAHTSGLLVVSCTAKGRQVFKKEGVEAAAIFAASQVRWLFCGGLAKRVSGAWPCARSSACELLRWGLLMGL